MHHPIDRPIFNGNRAVAINEFTRFLVCKVSATTGDTLMDTPNHFTALSPFRRSFFSVRKFALCSGQIVLVAPKKPRVVDVVSIGESSEAFQPHIDTHGVGVFLKRLRGHFARKARKPLSRRASPKGARLKSALNRAVQRNSDVANLGKLQDAFTYSATARHLREGKRVIATLPAKAWIAGVLTRLNPAKVGFECQINPNSNVLQNLRMNAGEGFARFLELGYRDCLGVIAEGFFLPSHDGFRCSRKWLYSQQHSSNVFCN